MGPVVCTRRHLRSRIVALALASTAFVQQAVSAPADIFESAAPVVGSDPPKARDIRDGDASIATKTGALQYSYPISVPPGRGGMAPSLALAYSSQASIYGTIAAGWSLSIPEIREDASQGRLATHSAYYEGLQSDPRADDRFTSSLAGGLPLVKVAEPVVTGEVYGAYRAQHDTTFARYERLEPTQSAKWRVRLTDGTTMLFGEPARTVGCANIGEGYAPLTTMVDAHGNAVHYEWESTIANECVIKEITWGYNTAISSLPFAKVAFKYKTNIRCSTSEGVYVGGQFDYRTGTKILTGANELEEITATAFPYGAVGSPTHTRRITLGYSGNTGNCNAGHAPFRQLTSIQESAWGPGLPQVDLPAVTFQYGNPAVTLSTIAANVGLPPWTDSLMANVKRQNLGWGSRAPQSAPDEWPTVEATMLDIDGDGLVDRLINTSTGNTCEARWQRNLGPTAGSSTPGFAGGIPIALPNLRWQNGTSPAPALFEKCALNGQVTAYKNVVASSTVKCHDGASVVAQGAACQASTNPKLATQLFCYSNNEPGLQCPVSGWSQGTYRTYLAYRWLDVDSDGLPDLVTAVHGNINAFDIVEGNAAGEPVYFNPPSNNPAAGPFGTWPACPTDFDRCLQLTRDCEASQQTLHTCIATAQQKACGTLPVTPFQAPGSPPQPPYVREPYSRCEGLSPWMIYKNLGGGSFATSPVIKYSPVPLESENGDSALGGASISSQGHGVFDFDGDGRLDAVKLDEVGNTWQVWRGDGTGGFEPRVHVVDKLTYPDFWISRNGIPSSYGDDMSLAQATFDANGDGLADRWVRNASGNATVAWHNGRTFDTTWTGLSYTGSVSTPSSPVALKPGNDTKFVGSVFVNGRVVSGDTYARNRTVDVDGDGRLDIVRLGTPPLSTPVDVHWNAGGNFIANSVAYGSNIKGVVRKSTAVNDSLLTWELTADLIDLNGDGIAESTSFNGNNLERYEHVVSGAPPRLLTSINNGTGATTAITYASIHDTSAVSQDPVATWPDGRRKVSPSTQWVVKQLATTDAFSGLTSTTTQFYVNPRHGGDKDGRYAFRGFEEVRTTTPANAQLIEKFAYDPDPTGRLVESRLHPTPGGAEVRTIDQTEWRELTLFGGAIKTFHASKRDHYTCANGQTVALCTTAAPAFTRTLIAQEAFSGVGGPALWQDTETVLQAGTGLADGDRRTTQTFQLKSETNLYSFRPFATVREHRVVGAWTTFAKSASHWDSDLRLKLTDEIWVDNNDANRAETRYVYDPDTGNLLERWKPMQNAAGTTRTTYTYDAKKLFTATETNELGHVQTHSYEYGTGSKLVTSGPNQAGCGGTCPVGAPPGSICLAAEQYETKIDGLGRPLEQWDTVSDDGCTMYYHKRSTTSYVDAAPVSSVTERMRIDSEAPTETHKRTDLDGLGRPIKETVFVQGTAPADQVTTYAYSAAGTLTAVEVPDPNANSTARVQYLYTYDTLKRPLTIRRPDSTTPSQKSGIDITYDGVTKTTKEVVGVATGNMAGTKTISDRFGRLAQVHEQAATFAWRITTYTYGPDDLVATIVDPQGVTTGLTHDFAGRRTQITRGSRLWKYGYDKNGNQISEQVPGSSGPLDDINYVTSTAYDDLDRPVQKLIGQRTLSPTDQDLFGGNVENFFYDGYGNMLGKLYFWESRKPDGTVAVSEHFRNTTQDQRWLTTQRMNSAGFANLERSFYQTFYLFGGTRSTLYDDQVGAGTQDTQSFIFYDARALPSSIQVITGPTSNSNVGVQTRNVAGLVTKRRSTLVAGGSNWVESNWDYDKLGRVTSQVVQKGPTIAAVARQDLTYFGNDNPRQLTHYLGTNANVFNYTYDWRHQLVAASSTTPGYFQGTYSYGNAGRLATANEAQSPAPLGSEVKPRNVNYVYGGTDPEQVTALTNVSGGATYASFSYDLAGNMTAKCTGGQVATCTGAGMEKLEYIYDGSDQLRRVTRKLAGSVTGSEEYWYGMAGNRMTIVKRGAAGAISEMIWFIGDTQAHYYPNGTVNHVYSNVALGTPVARVDRTADTVTATEYQFHGLASSTLATVADTGTINASFRYSPWGAVVEATDAGGGGGGTNGVTAHRRRHNHKYVDEISSLSYYGARYYDRTLIGWTQSDPLFRFAPDAAWSQPRMALLYTYSLQNALRYLDLDGLAPIWEAMKGGPSEEKAKEWASESNSAYGVLTSVNVWARALDMAGAIAGELAGEPQVAVVDFDDPGAGTFLGPPGGPSAPSAGPPGAPPGGAPPGGAPPAGKVYKVPGEDTPSGKPYVGRTQQAQPKDRGKADGRDRTNAEIIDRYDPAVPGAGRQAEQKGMNKNGGKENLDNKRDEIRKDKWEDNDVKPPTDPTNKIE